jgi:hypothetical protein
VRSSRPASQCRKVDMGGARVTVSRAAILWLAPGRSRKMKRRSPAVSAMLGDGCGSARLAAPFFEGYALMCCGVDWAANVIALLTGGGAAS